MKECQHPQLLKQSICSLEKLKKSFVTKFLAKNISKSLKGSLFKKEKKSRILFYTSFYYPRNTNIHTRFKIQGTRPKRISNLRKKYLFL